MPAPWTIVGPLRSSLVSYLGGTLCCIVALLATRQTLNIAPAGFTANWWLWTGGLYGLVYWRSSSG